MIWLTPRVVLYLKPELPLSIVTLLKSELALTTKTQRQVQLMSSALSAQRPNLSMPSCYMSCKGDYNTASFEAANLKPRLQSPKYKIFIHQLPSNSLTAINRVSILSTDFPHNAFTHYNFIMLKFLENRQQDRSPKRSPIKYQPEMCYGNSFESPQEFQTTNTIFHAKTYLNPFLKFEKIRSDKMPETAALALEPRWTRKRNLSMVEEHKILKEDHEENYNDMKSRYLDSFHQQLEGNPQRFRITRGEFTNFIEKNNHYKSIGPLQGIERTVDRIEDRRKSVWVKSPSKREEMTASLRYASSLNTTVKSSISKNSELITEKYRIRKNRERIQKIFKRDLQNRKKSPTKYQFSLTKDGSETEFYLPEANLHHNRAAFNAEVDLQDLERFESKIYRKLK